MTNYTIDEKIKTVDELSDLIHGKSKAEELYPKTQIILAHLGYMGNNGHLKKVVLEKVVLELEKMVNRDVDLNLKYLSDESAPTIDVTRESKKIAIYQFRRRNRKEDRHYSPQGFLSYLGSLWK